MHLISFTSLHSLTHPKSYELNNRTFSAGFPDYEGTWKGKNAGKTLAVLRFLEHCTAVTQHICEIAEKSPPTTPQSWQMSAVLTLCKVCTKVSDHHLHHELLVTSCHEWLITHWLHQLLKVGVAKKIVTQPKFGKNIAQILCFCCFCRNDRKPQLWCWLALKRQLIGNSIASAFKVQQWSTLFCDFHEKIHRMSNKKRFSTTRICTWKKKVCRL